MMTTVRIGPVLVEDGGWAGTADPLRAALAHELETRLRQAGPGAPLSARTARDLVIGAVSDVLTKAARS